MDLRLRFSSLVRNILRRRSVESELDEEVCAYLDLLTEDKVRAGMSLREARRAARLELGGVDQVKEEVRQARAGVLLDTLWRDIRSATRSLSRSPGFTFAAIAVMALGIGVNSAVFSVIHGVLLRPLPFKDPERIVQIRETLLSKGVDEMACAPADFEYWRDQNHVFSQMAGYHTHSSLNLTGTGEPERLATATVSASFLKVLGVMPELGRDFLSEDESPGGKSVVIISHRLWVDRFGSARDMPGRSINLNGQSYTVVGVMPARFDFPRRVDLWTPLILPASHSEAAHWRNLDRVLARLDTNVSLEQAHAEMDTFSSSLVQQYPDKNGGVGVSVRPLMDVVVGGVRQTLVVLMTAVLLVLLAASANVAGLTLVRAAGRQKEMALRVALGAGRGRLIRQLVTESVSISLAGAALGLLLAYWGVDFLLAIAGDNVPRTDSIRVDTSVLAFTLLSAVLTGVFFGLAPAIQASRPSLIECLRGGGRTSAGPTRQTFRHVMAVTELALALSLMIGAGLMMKSFAELQKVSLGFNPDNVLTMSITLPEARRKQAGTFFPDVVRRIEGLQGVTAAGAVWPVPLSDSDLISTYKIEGRQPTGDDTIDTPLCNFYSATPGYFKGMGTKLLRGRYFDDSDGAASRKVVIISDTFAKRFFPGEDPIGRRLLDDGPLEIVGVIGDVLQQYSLDEVRLPQVYAPFSQTTFGGMALVVRTDRAPAGLVASVRSQVTAIEPDQPVADIKTMDEYVSNGRSQSRMTMLLMSIFAVVSMVLAAVGLYGVMAHSVVQRTREIGVRLALGAQRPQVLRLVMAEGMIQTAIGLALGLGGAFALTRLMSSLLYGVSTTDAAVFACVPAALTAVALLACFVPARRAAGVDPMVALRHE